MIPAPKSPEHALTITPQLEVGRFEDPRIRDFYEAVRQTLQDISGHVSTLLAGVFGTWPVGSLPPRPTAHVTLLSELASLARTLAEVIQARGKALDKIDDQQELAKLMPVLIEAAMQGYAAFGIAVVMVSNVIIHGVVPASHANRYVEGTIAGMLPYHEHGPVEIHKREEPALPAQ